MVHPRVHHVPWLKSAVLVDKKRNTSLKASRSLASPNQSLLYPPCFSTNGKDVNKRLFHYQWQHILFKLDIF